MQLVLKDLILQVAVSDHSPATLNQGFLRGTDVVPEDWSLLQEPVCSVDGSQVAFANGITLLAQGQMVSGQESLDAGHAGDPQLPAVLVRYCEALPRLDYRGLQTLLRVVALFEGESEAARQFICERLLQPGPWQEFGVEPMRATLQLSYRLEGEVLSLGIAEAQMRQGDEPTGSALVFAGTFEQLVQDGSSAHQQIRTFLEGWRLKRDKLLNLLEHHFALP